MVIIHKYLIILMVKTTPIIYALHTAQCHWVLGSWAEEDKILKGSVFVSME